MTDGCILVVEDLHPLRRLLVMKLEELGYPVRDTPDPDEAIERVRVERPWLVITDYSMPGMNGVELARRLKEECPGLPVVLWSSQPPPETAPADYVVTDKSEFASVLSVVRHLAATA